MERTRTENSHSAKNIENNQRNTPNASFKLNVATLNIRGLHNKDKRDTLKQWIIDKNIEILFLQETYCTEQLEVITKREYSNIGNIYHSKSTSNHSKGVAIIISKQISFKTIDYNYDNEGRVLLINGNINDTCFTLVNLYAPRTPNDRIDFFKKIQKFVQQKAKSTNIIISGDMNTIDDKKDRSSQKVEKCSKAYTQMKSALHITDSWRYLNNTKLDYTYTSNHAHITHSRIDHILISNSLLAHLCKAEIIIAPASDRKTVHVVIDTEYNKRRERLLETK